MSRLHQMKKGAIEQPGVEGYVSKRKGMRHNRILKKTAKALGLNWEPTQGWKTRNQGIASAKAEKAREQKKLASAGKQAAKGDLKA